MSGRTSRHCLLAICAVMVIVRTSVPQRDALTWDVFGYYLYLPALFIHDDPGLRDAAWLDGVMSTYEPSSTLYQVVDGPQGGRVIKYSAGMALAYAPFFLLAHTLAGPLGHTADGFSTPYQVIITYGCLLLALLGLFLLRRVLLRYFTDGLVAALLVSIALGTNYLQLTAWDGTLLTHPFLFTLYAGLLLATIHWHERPDWKSALAIGACAGWITLVRPSEGVCILIPLLWMGPEGFRAKWGQVLAQWKHAVAMVLAFILMASPQLLYWKGVTGQWLFYSYINPGEGFDFATPHITEYLFSFRKGWFVYTPLALLMVFGLATLWRRARHVFWPVTAFLVIDLYIVASWSNWWYAGGSFSARSMVPAYVVLALPLGFLLNAAWQRERWRLPVSGIATACVALNGFQTWQWTQGILSKERMTRAYYFTVFGRTSIPAGAEYLLRVARPTTSVESFSDEDRYTVRELFSADFNDRPDGVFHLTPEEPFSPGPHVTYAQLTDKDHAWLRTTVRLWVGDTVQPPPTIVMTFHHDGETYKYAAGTWEVPEGTRNTWLTTTMDYITPEVRSTTDDLKVYVWNQHGGHHRIDDLSVRLFERK